MIDINHAIDVAKLLIATAEGLAQAIDKAKHALETGTAQLKQALAEAEKMRDQLAADRKEADDALDRKFDSSTEGGGRHLELEGRTVSVLKRGSQGAEVTQLQLRLKSLGYYDGDVDGDFGPKTAAAVLAFQQAYDELVDDEIAGPLTQARIAQALVIKPPSPPPITTTAIVPCSAATFAAFMRFIAVIVGTVTGKPVRYGPGRGLFVGDKFVVTHGPGALGAKAWNGGQTFASFHCTAFTNFVLGWLGRRNGDYTHAGNIPELWTLCEASADEHVVPQDGWVLRYRGYGDMCSPILTDGSTTKRAGISKVIDAKELLARARAGTLPTFVVFGQSTLINGKWKWWHHTGLFVVWENRLYRIAADGFYANGRWNGQPMQYVEVTDANVGNLAACLYRCYGVNTVDGSYGDQTRPIADVVFET